MKGTIIILLLALSTASSYAATYSYLCKDHGKLYPLEVDDENNTLEWKGVTFNIKEKDDCGRAGWHAEKDGTSFDFCTATQGAADIEQNGADIQCNMKGR